MCGISTGRNTKHHSAYICRRKKINPIHMNKPGVLITGAASGIGRATAIRFAREGYDVCANDIQEEKLRMLLNELEPGNHLILPGSYTAMETINKGQQLISESWGSLNVLVNCAGIG